jgi:hypothetical protein
MLAYLTIPSSLIVIYDVVAFFALYKALVFGPERAVLPWGLGYIFGAVITAWSMGVGAGVAAAAAFMLVNIAADQVAEDEDC